MLKEILLQSLHKFIISPPFGTYISSKKATSVLGTFTLIPRPGKWGQVFKTLRYTKDGWVNRIGLRNPGMKSIKYWDYNKIYSFQALGTEWIDVINHVPELVHMEMNVSCPNVNTATDPLDIDAWVLLTVAARPRPVIIKVPPLVDIGILRAYHQCGIKYFHISNTYPTDRGGLSGRKLQQYNLPQIELVKRAMPDVKVIGGGGIYTKEDLRRYEDAGADYFSLATVWFTPWRALDLLAEDKPYYEPPAIPPC